MDPLYDRNRTTLEEHTDGVTSVAFSPDLDSKILASGSADDTIKLWDVDSKSEIATLEGHSYDVTSVAFSPDGKYLASGSADGTIKLWDVDSKSEIISLEGHTGAVTSVAFSPDLDSKILASGSADNTIKLWKVLFLSQPTSLPKLSIAEIDFSGFGEVLNAGEEVTVKIRIKNDGTADASNLKVVLSSDLQGLSFRDTTDVDKTISKGGGEETVPIIIRSGSDLPTAKGRLDIRVIDTKFEQQSRSRHWEFNTLAFDDIDVHKGIPEAAMKNPKAVAVVIGNRNYTHKDVPPVDYAHNDALIVKEYLIRTLGYKEKNILYRPDATKGVFDDVFGTSDNHKGTLLNRVLSLDGPSDIFIYYSGHGAPDINSKLDEKPAYLVPVDANPSNVALGGYKLDWLYQNLKKIPYRHAIVVIDACFSGITAAGTLIPDISGLGLPVDEFPSLPDRSAIFTAAGSQQVANWYNDKQHGLFTYFFLKALRGEADVDGNKELTTSEISKYVGRQVLSTARRLHNRDQNPQFLVIRTLCW